MADIKKITAKNVESIKAPLIPQVEESRQDEPLAVSKVKKTRPKKRNAEAAPRKSGLEYLGRDKKPNKKKKQKKVKLVRDSFTMPENDYANIAALKAKCLIAGVHVKKSELLRAGLAYLTKLSNSVLLKTIKQVEKIKTGRPAKHR